MYYLSKELNIKRTAHMETINDTETNDVLAEVNIKSGMSKDPKVVLEALQYAANRFNLKLSKSKKGTYHETWNLNTTYSNCSEVADFLRYTAMVFVDVCNGRVSFPAGWYLN